MAKFLLVHHGSDDATPMEGPPDPDEMAARGAWFGELGAAVVDGGNPIGASATVASDGSSTPGGGADPRARGCLVLKGGGSIEVCATIDI